MDLLLQTPRLILRPFTQSDISAVINITTNKGVSCFMQDMIYDTYDKAKFWINMLHHRYDPKLPFSILAIVLRETGEPIGYIGLHPKEELDNEIEILYAVMDTHQRKGYAAEAGQTLVSWCFETSSATSITAIVKPDNSSSNRVVQKLGFEQEGDKTVSYNGTDTLFHYYRLNKTK